MKKKMYITKSCIDKIIFHNLIKCIKKKHLTQKIITHNYIMYIIFKAEQCEVFRIMVYIKCNYNKF